ncbi:MAG: hypothetical protein PWQ77_673 [Kosmotogales bacterium]|nr:hypothetical protein [Kosmotogales bacterium]
MKKLKVEDIYNYKILGAVNFIDNDSFLFVKKVLNEEKNTYESSIWIHNLNEKSFKRLTAGVNDSNPVFNSEKNEVIFLSKRDKDKKEIGLYKISMEFGEAELIKEYSDSPANIQWKKKNEIFYTKNERYDGKKIEKEEDDKKIYHFKHIPFLANGQGFREDVGNHLFKFNLKTKKEECLIKGFVNVNNFDLSDDGRRLAVCLNKNPEDPVKASAFLYDLKEDKKEEIGIEGYTVSKVLWSDNRSIFILASDESRGFATSPTLFIYDTDTKMLKMLIDPKKNEFSLGNSLNSDVLGVAGRNFKVHDKRLYFIATEGIHTSIYSISSKAEIKKEVNFESSITDFDISSANNVAFIRSSSITPSEIYYYDYSDFYKVSEYNDWFYKKVNSEVKFIKFNSSDGKEIDGLILFPPEFEDENKKYPAILEIHGGPRTAYGNSYMHEFQALASKGYVVIACNPRGSSGYGSDFADILKHYGERDFKDIMEFVEFCIENYKFIDKDRIGVTGGSYGGFMTNWIVGHTTFFKAAVSQRSISNWFSMYGSTDIGYYFSEDQIGEDYLAEPYKFIKQSPIFYSKNVKTPILFIHSLNDFRCEVQQAMQFFTTLKRLGKKTEMILFPGETHELSRSGKPVHRIKRLNAMIDWFNKYLK